MATYEISAPDGSRYQVDAPDEAPQDEVLNTFHQHLSQQQADQADQEVAASRDVWKRGTAGLPMVTPLSAADFLRQAARGQVWGSYLDEGLAGLSDVAHKATGGAIGQPYDKAVALERAKNRAADKAGNQEIADLPLLGPVTVSGATKFGGGLVGGVPLADKLLKGGNLAWRAAKSSGLGAAIGGIYGYGEGEDPESRIEQAKSGATWGSILGGFLPPAVQGGTAAGRAVRDFASPKLARARAALEALPEKISPFPRMSADGAAPETAGARAAAEQMLADQMLREGKTPEDFRRQMAEAERASLYGGGGPRGTSGASYARNDLALADMSPGMQKIAGSAVRKSPEAANWAGMFQSARQTGVTPAEAPLPPEMGLATRPLMSQPTDEPVGQVGRLLDAYRRALRIEDVEHHGHEATAYKTEQKIMADAREKAKPNYAEAKTAGEGVDLAPHLEPVLNKWATSGIEDEAPQVQNALNKAIEQFRSAGTITKFDNLKKFLDSQIEGLYQSKGPGFANRPQTDAEYVGGKLNALKNDMLEAVRGVKQNKLGELYGKALDEFSDAMSMKKALNIGSQALAKDSEIGIEHFDQFAGNPAAQKMFRLGTYGSLEKSFGEKRLSQDATLALQKRRVQQLMQHIIPREGLTPTGRMSLKGGEPAVFYDRPERFGRLVQNEQRMQTGGAKVFGNSATVERMADDEAYQVLSNVFDVMKEGAKAASKGGVDVWMTMLNFVPGVLKHVFGIRQDEAASIARQLYTTDKGQIARTLANVEMRLGRNRYQRFSELIGQHHAQLMQAGTVTGTQGGE